ncbi:MAG: ATPase, T2SS/T4P/T4SS family [Planctomycetota bacterium]|nr:ATPase, T2SS/T4P/T4SS family [Planctomycetota bacterium]
MSVPPQAARELIGQLLKKAGHVKESGVQEALAEQRKHGGLIGAHLVTLGHVKPSDLAVQLAHQAGLEAVDLSRAVPTDDAIEAVDATTAHAFNVLPLSVTGKAAGRVLRVAIADPMNVAVLEDLRFTTGMTVVGCLGEGGRLRELIEQHYGAEESLSDVIAAAARDAGNVDPQDAAASAPVVRLLNSILHRAIRDRASDVHFEVFPGELRIRYRVDGSLYEIEAPPAHLAPAILARIKVMSDLDIAETKLPQDGRISLVIDSRPVDLRVATLPGIAGEGAVLRVLDRSAVSLDLAALGLEHEDAQKLRSLCELPHGIVLVTGPTGSGKTTTLYAMLSEINDPSTKIITVEDPVEYDIEGLVQVPINDEIGVTYAKVLRTVLRQDPDKILVGEIRDGDTASTAVEASLTGHTVFATVHTNDAPSAITRLIDMGIQPFLITATLEAVVAQRLVRTICADCKDHYDADEDLVRELGSDGERLRGARLAFGKGCDECFHTGYRGRTAIHEIMLLDRPIREAIGRGAATAEVRRLAIAAGMRTLRLSGLERVVAGVTTVDEVIRETMM